ncbi:unnamed protein product [Peronospora belbahrii]|nr:unnamed protein product [Peronospora belbahrii]
MNICNYESDDSDDYSIHLGVSSIPSCDVNNATVPVMASLVVADECTADHCAATVNFESSLDWAIALQSNGVSNTLTAQLTSGGNTDVVHVATFQPMAAAVMSSGTANISVCATDVDVTGLRFSSVDSCNTAQICRGSSMDTTCTTGLMNNAYVRNVSCSGESCKGKVMLSEPLPCDGSTGIATNLIMGMKVANSTQSNFVSVGSMTAPTFNISDASGFDIGSSELVLTTNTFCVNSGISLNLSFADGSVYGSSETMVEVGKVSKVNSTTNGTVIVELASPLSGELVDDKIEVSLSQCGVSATGLFSVGMGSSGSSSALNGSTEVSNVDAGLTDSTGSVSTQEANSSTGLSNSIIVGSVIAGVALAGFIFEYVYHKRRQPMPMAQDSPVVTPV